MIQFLVLQVKMGKIAIADIPEKYKTSVEQLLGKE